MIDTNYIGMQIGKFVVKEYRIEQENNMIVLRAKCSNCETNKSIKIKSNKVTKVRCKKCGTSCVLVPISYCNGTDIVKDTVTITESIYKNIKEQFNKTGQNGEKEIDFILKELKQIGE